MPGSAQKKSYVKTFTQYDYILLFITIGIALFGVLMIYSAGYYAAAVFDSPFRFVRSQIVGLCVGAVLMFVISKIDYQVFMNAIFGDRYKITPCHVIYVAALLLQILVLFVGEEYNGAKRWLKIGPIQFQPSEISKIAVILFISYAVYRNRRALDSVLGFLSIMAYIMPFIILIGVENLSSCIIVMGIAVGMCFIASRKKLYFIVGILAAALLVFLYIVFGDPFRIQRIDIWLHVETHPNALQIKQGLYAIASGGLFGKGLGQSMQKLGYIPEAYNDMIFAVICEELGIVGAALVILAFLALIWRIIVVACHAPDIFGAMLCSGVMLQLAIQVIINVAVVTNSIPSTGVPLPFISYGGTSEMIMMAEMGFVLGVSRQIKQK